MNPGTPRVSCGAGCEEEACEAGADGAVGVDTGGLLPGRGPRRKGCEGAWAKLPRAIARVDFVTGAPRFGR